MIWRLLLEEFIPELIHIEGYENIIDALSTLDINYVMNIIIIK